MKKEKIYIEVDNNNHIKVVNPDDINEAYFKTLLSKESLKFMGDVNAHSVNKKYLQSYIREQYHSKNTFLFGLFQDEALIATTRIHDIEGEAAWQGILVFEEFQGHGYGFTILNHVSNYALKNLGLENISAGILAKNSSSKKLFNKCGFSYIKDDPNFPGRQIWQKKNV